MIDFKNAQEIADFIATNVKYALIQETHEYGSIEQVFHRQILLALKEKKGNNKDIDFGSECLYKSLYLKTSHLLREPSEENKYGSSVDICMRHKDKDFLWIELKDVRNNGDITKFAEDITKLICFDYKSLRNGVISKLWENKSSFCRYHAEKIKDNGHDFVCVAILIDNNKISFTKPDFKAQLEKKLKNIRTHLGYIKDEYIKTKIDEISTNSSLEFKTLDKPYNNMHIAVVLFEGFDNKK